MSHEEQDPIGRPDRVHVCPDCTERIYYTPRVEMRGVQQFDPELHCPPDDNDRGEIFRSGTFVCPHCGRRLQAFLEVHIHRIVTVGRRDEHVPRRSNLLAGEQKLIDKMCETGLVDAFTDVVIEVGSQPGGRSPRNIITFFVNFLRQAKLVRIRKHLLAALKNVHNNSYLQFYQAQGIVMVVANDRIARFIPWSILKNDDFFKGCRGTFHGTPVPSRKNELDKLIRSSIGYVPAEGQLFLTEILQTVAPHRNGSRDCTLPKSRK